MFRSPIMRLDFGEFCEVDDSWSERLFDCLRCLYMEVMVSFLLFWSINSVATNSRSSESLRDEDLGPHTIEVVAFCMLCSTEGF